MTASRHTANATTASGPVATRAASGLPAPQWGDTTEEARSFLQERVGNFGLLVGGIGMVFFVIRIILNLVGVWAEDSLLGPSVTLHLVGALGFLSLWLFCRWGPRSVRAVHAVENAGLLAGCAAYVAMGLFIPTHARPDLVVILALTYGLVGRAVYVPSTARHTLLLGFILGAVLVPTMYVHFLDYDTTPWLDAHPEMAEWSSHQTAGTIALGIAIWWSLSVAVATATSHVIYGLRREMHDIQRLGQYTLEEKLGAGGMGEVYRARHALLRRPTAIKLLRPEKAGAESIERFEREVQLTSQLTHPNTIAIYDYGHTPAGAFYYAMEYLEGIDLDRLVEDDGPQPAGRVIFLLRQICLSLSEAHTRGLVHRDVKPANVIVCERGGFHDVVKVVDFGLVRHVERGQDVDVTGDNVITGTPLYMAPESIRDSRAADARSDLYSVGAVAYYLLAGSHVFEAKSAVEVLGQQLHVEPDPPARRAGRDVPPDLERLVMGCLAKEPARRPQTALEVVGALDACAAAGAWNEEAARAWWEGRPHEPPPVRDGATAPTHTAAVPTVEIDLEERRA